MFPELFKTGFIIPDISPSSAHEAVYLLQYSTWGHHSLGFYRDGQLIEFTYGDWDMFALDKRDLFTAVTHMVFPTLGALGRKIIVWSPEQPAIAQFTDCIDIVPFPAESQSVETLFKRLNGEFNARISEQVYHAADDLYFVPYQVNYSLLNNCNHELAKWLVELNGQVSGRVFWNPDFIAGMRPRLPSIP